MSSTTTSRGVIPRARSPVASTPMPSPHRGETRCGARRRSVGFSATRPTSVESFGTRPKPSLTPGPDERTVRCLGLERTGSRFRCRRSSPTMSSSPPSRSVGTTHSGVRATSAPKHGSCAAWCTAGRAAPRSAAARCVDAMAPSTVTTTVGTTTPSAPAAKSCAVLNVTSAPTSWMRSSSIKSETLCSVRTCSWRVTSR